MKDLFIDIQEELERAELDFHAIAQKFGVSHADVCAVWDELALQHEQELSDRNRPIEADASWLDIEY
jgi:hypothetical protein